MSEAAPPPDPEAAATGDASATAKDANATAQDAITTAQAADGTAMAADGTALVDEAIVEPSVLTLTMPLLVLAVGAAVMVLRLVPGPVATWLADYASFDNLPEATQLHVDDLLLVPIASVLVVFCRVSMGLRMLGPFRPILIALAFYQTGVLAGSVFMAAVLAVVTCLRPRLANGLLPYFGRLTVLLSCVVLIELMVLLLGHHLESEYILQASVFPIVVLCLSADGFARVLSSDGLGPAIWRGTTTVAIAATISTIGNIDEFADFLFEFPEFVLVEIALILFISTRMKWDLLARSQPDGSRSDDSKSDG
tara:strand:+ start:78676 stop:79602 length:927 start_codon:yes stop_codon:yes gene_type:complete